MARGRMIATTVATDKRLNSLSEDAELVFLKTVPHLDRDGIIIGDPVLLAAQVCPRRPRLVAMIEDIIQEWLDAGLAVSYTPGEDPLLFFPGFSKNQVGMRYDREPASLFPPPPGYYRNGAGLEPVGEKADTPQDDGNNPPASGKLPASFRQASGKLPPEEKRIEKNRTEGEINVTGESDLTGQPAPAPAREEPPPESTPETPTPWQPVSEDPEPARQPGWSGNVSQTKGVNEGKAPPGQYVKRGTGETPYWVFREYTRRGMTHLQIEAINRTVTDISHWRKVCERWAELYGEEWKKFGHLDWYRNGIPSQNGANNGYNRSQAKTGSPANGRTPGGVRPSAGQPPGGSVQADGYKLDAHKLTADLVNKRITEAEYNERLHALKLAYGVPVVQGARPLPPS